MNGYGGHYVNNQAHFFSRSVERNLPYSPGMHVLKWRQDLGMQHFGTKNSSQLYSCV